MWRGAEGHEVCCTAEELAKGAQKVLVAVGLDQKSANVTVRGLLAASGDVIESTLAELGGIDEIRGRASAIAREAYRVTARRQGTSPRGARLQ
jgi:hypothetical protein